MRELSPEADGSFKYSNQFTLVARKKKKRKNGGTAPVPIPEELVARTKVELRTDPGWINEMKGTFISLAL